MIDELTRIERIYGCLPEYYRSMEEEYYEEPTEEELEKANKEMEAYHRKVHLLNGTPSEFAKKLKDEWEKRRPKEEDYDDRTNSYFYALHDYASEKTLDIVEKIASKYNVDVDEKWATFYRPGVKKFGISVEYRKRGNIYYKHIGGLDYETFKNVFRDLEYSGLWPTMSTEISKDKVKILSGCTLGNLRATDLEWLGWETKEGLEKELKSLGFYEA